MQSFTLFLFEIKTEDLWFIGVGFVGALIILGSIAGAVKSIRGEIIAPLVTVFISPGRARKRQLAEVVEAVKTLSEQSTKILAELTTNGGSSVKDAVGRIEKHCDYANSKFRYEDEICDIPTFEMDEQANLIFANHALCKLVAADESDLLGKNWISKVPAADRQNTLAEWRIAAENKCPIDVQHQLVLDGKTRIAVRVQAAPRLNQLGALRGFFGRMNRVDEQ